jgi:hypothetical protein
VHRKGDGVRDEPGHHQTQADHGEQPGEQAGTALCGVDVRTQTHLEVVSDEVGERGDDGAGRDEREVELVAGVARLVAQFGEVEPPPIAL